MFRPLIEPLLNFDPFLVLAEYVDYLQCQERVSTTRRDQARRTHMSILNTMGAGKFSSDRSTSEYCEQIWQIAPVRIGP
jgi:glycogen phosphorylase